MLQGIQGLHAQGRGHCDVKPQNIRVLLSNKGQVLQCTLHDLGCSVVYSGECSTANMVTLLCIDFHGEAAHASSTPELLSAMPHILFVDPTAVQDLLKTNRSTTRGRETSAAQRFAALRLGVRLHLGISVAWLRMYGVWATCGIGC